MKEEINLSEKISGEKIEREKHLVKAFENGLDSEDILLFHGTSMEVFSDLINKGKIYAGGTVDKNNHNKPGDMYFHVKPSNLPKGFDLSDDLKDEDYAIKMASGYAGMISKEHFIMDQLGLDKNNSNVRIDLRALLDEIKNYNDFETDEVIAALGICKEDFFKAIKKAEERKGVILGIDKKVLDNHTLVEGDDPGYDFMINFPEGMNYDLIVGIEPLGQTEYNFFEKLQNKYDQ